MNLVVDIQYFSPSILYFTLGKFRHCVFDQYEHYQKMSFRNRCTVMGGNGPVHLSIPLIGGRNQKTIMKDVRILNTGNWQDRHWKTITSCYNKSPWFGHYSEDLEKLYQTRFEFLADWNIECFRWAADKLSIQTPVTLSETYRGTYDTNEYVDWRNRLLPSTVNQNFQDAKRYPQVFEDRFGFVPNLSILDYLFCAGNKFQ